MDYPIWDLALGGGMLMALVAIPHVIVSHFAIGGGLLIVVTETLAVKRGDAQLRELAKRSSL
ncbi:MAG: cytochrome C, partial [Acidobacteriota bacterium]